MDLDKLLPKLHCWFHIWGLHLDPDAITRATGVTPDRAYLPGAGRQASNPKAVYGRHGYWSWKGPEGDDPKPLLDQWHDLFATTSGALGEVLHDDDDVTLTLVGHVPAWPVLRVEQIAGMHVVGEAVYPRYNPDGFEPFLDTERLPVALDLKHIDLLAKLRCAFDTHIDYDLLTEDEP